VPMNEAMEAFLAQFDTNGEDRDQMSEVGGQRTEDKDRGRRSERFDDLTI